MKLAKNIPWWAKIGAKIALARAPVPYSAWRRIGIFRHGAMIDPAYSRGIFEQYIGAIRVHGGTLRSILELGPGDSVATAIWAAAAGIAQTTLVDAGRFATTGIEGYRAALQAAGPACAGAAAAADVDAMLAALGARYLCEGLASLQAIPDESIDAVFSNAVLEHVRRGEFEETVRQMLRIQRRGSVAMHGIDLRDHLGGALNSLRISPERWESPLFANSGFYTNRLRASEIRRIFTDAGFQILECQERRWENLPTPRSVMHPAFAALTDDDLLISGVKLVVRRPAA